MCINIIFFKSSCTFKGDVLQKKMSWHVALNCLKPIISFPVTSALCLNPYLKHNVFREMMEQQLLVCFVRQYDVNVPGLPLGQKPKIQYIL